MRPWWCLLCLYVLMGSWQAPTLSSEAARVGGTDLVPSQEKGHLLPWSMSLAPDGGHARPRPLQHVLARPSRETGPGLGGQNRKDHSACHHKRSNNHITVCRTRLTDEHRRAYNKVRLFTTQTRNENDHLKSPENITELSYWSLNRTRREVDPIIFECPNDKCKLNDCFVASPELYVDGRWWWSVLSTKRIELSQTSTNAVKVKYTPPTIEDVELWCFTKQQLDTNPDCAQWKVNFQSVPGKIRSCRALETHEYYDHLTPALFSSVNQMRPKTATPSPKRTGQSVQAPKVIKTNSALSLMIDYARERNLSNCWLCQNMPESMHASMLVPIPFSKTDYDVFNWNDVASRLVDEADDCYTPSYPIGSQSFDKYSRFEDIARDTAKAINDQYLPPGLNYTTLLRIIYVQMYVKLGFEYRIQITLAQTNCSNPPGDQICVQQPYAATVIAEALVYIQPWLGTQSIGSVKVKIHNCSEPLHSQPTPLRDCSTYIPPVLTHDLQNVSLCLQGVGRNTHEDLGQSSCLKSVTVTLKQSPLPERVYLVCGDKAYSCVPYDNAYGTCYLAYLVPMIREVDSSEIAALYPPLHKHKRELSSFQRIAGIVLPFYGVYVTQQELSSLSKILENHLNASNKAMLAEHKELQEVKTVVLQNRMALDLLLAAQGGTCKVIGTECCSYISDATAEVMDMAHDTAQGIKELHATHGFDLGDFSSTFGTWGSGILKFLTTIVVFLLLFILIGTCLVSIIKLIIRRSARTVTQAPQAVVKYDNDDVTVMFYPDVEQWEFPYAFSEDCGSSDDCV